MRIDIEAEKSSVAGRGDCLLRLARAALLEELEGRPAWAPALRLVDAPWLRSPGATFVTLRCDERLRGCIGSLEARRPLADNVRDNAVGAATRDPRFTSLSAAELPRVVIEVSLLGPQEKLELDGEAAARRLLRPGVDGVVLSWRDRRATFLPQVWQQLPSAADFLAELKKKAGLHEAFWDAELALFRYSVDKWSEA